MKTFKQKVPWWLFGQFWFLDNSLRWFLMGSPNCTYQVKTHYGGPKMVSHCTVLHWCLCLNFNHDNIKVYFFIFLLNMVDYNTKSSITKKILFSNLYLRLQSIFVTKKCTSICTKNANILKKWFLNFYTICNILLNIVIPYDWNKFVSHVKNLIIIISQMGVFGGYHHKYVVN